MEVPAATKNDPAYYWPARGNKKLALSRKCRYADSQEMTNKTSESYEEYRLRRISYKEHRPWRIANFVRPAMEWISSFFMILCRCVSTVRALMCIACAISALELPSAIN